MRKWALTTHRICQRLDLGLFSLQHCEREISAVHKPTSLYWCYTTSQKTLCVSVKISKRGNLIGPAPHCGFHSHPPHSKWSLQASYYHLWPRKLGAFQAWECLTLEIRKLSQKVFLRPLCDKYTSPILPDGFEGGFTEEVKYKLGFKGGSPCS